MKRNALPIVLLLGLLTSCVVGPDYRRPQVAAPDVLRGQADASTSLADRAWWEILDDDVLESLIEEALRSGYDVRLAAARVDEARAIAGIARSEYFPQIVAGAGWSRGSESEFVLPGVGTQELYDVRLGVAWEIDLWGRIRRLNEAGLAEYLGTEEARRGVVLSLVSEIATSYFRLRALDRQLEIAQRTADAFDETHSLFDRRLEAGLASSLETASAAASLATTRASIPDLERQIVSEENRLSVLLGRNPGPVLRGVALEAQLLPPEIPAGIPSELLERRPDLREAEQELVRANALVGVAVANYFPCISLTAAFGGVAPQVSELFDEGRMWSIGGGLLTPVLQGRRLKNEHVAAQARWEQAKVRYERSVTEAFSEVSTALVAYRRLGDVETERAEAVEQYRDAVRLANSRYLSGLADYLEVLEAQQQLFPAENALVATRFERLATLMELYRALGGGWKTGSGLGVRSQGQVSGSGTET